MIVQQIIRAKIRSMSVYYLGSNMKPIYASKINWAMVVLAIISIMEVVRDWHAKGDLSFEGCTGLAIAVLVVILRTFFTDQPINHGQGPDQSGAIYGEPRG